MSLAADTLIQADWEPLLRFWQGPDDPPLFATGLRSGRFKATICRNIGNSSSEDLLIPVIRNVTGFRQFT